MVFLSFLTYFGYLLNNYWFKLVIGRFVGGDQGHMGLCKRSIRKIREFVFGIRWTILFALGINAETNNAKGILRD